MRKASDVAETRRENRDRYVYECLFCACAYFAVNDR
jgi:hypothetical protein